MRPFSEGLLAASSASTLFVNARPGGPLPSTARTWTCVQSFRPQADALQAAGFPVLADWPDGVFDQVLLLLPRQRQRSRGMLARGLRALAPGGVLVASQANDEGARSSVADLERLAGPVQQLAKHHCRVAWLGPERAAPDDALIDQWLAEDAPRPILDGQAWSRPGVFAWDRVDAGSALLSSHLPAGLSGAAADLGAGWGYLSLQLRARCPGITSLDLFEADADALAMARRNLADASIDCRFHWQDVARGIPGRYDVIVSNPPFHPQARAEDPDLGRAFIAAAAAALRPGGRFWLVANRHLPYEAALARGFARWREVAVSGGFKVIEAIGATP